MSYLEFAKVRPSLWDGTLAEHWEAWALFVFMLAHADANGVVDMTPRAISRRSGMPIEIVDAGLALLSSPDPESRTPDEEGRRIVLIDPARRWGWRVVNIRRYRDLRDQGATRAQGRARTERWRARQERLGLDGEGQSDRQTVTGGDGESVTVTDGDGRKRYREGEGDGDRYSSSGLRPSELLAPLPGEFVRLPLAGRSEPHPITIDEVAELQKLYPGVDVEQQLRHMLGWLIANPAKRKTPRGVGGFVHRWLSSEQDSGRGRGAGQAPGTRRAADVGYLAGNRSALGEGRDS